MDVRPFCIVLFALILHDIAYPAYIPASSYLSSIKWEHRLTQTKIKTEKNGKTQKKHGNV